MKKTKRNTDRPGKEKPRKAQIHDVDEFPSGFPSSEIADTAQELVEIYESVERSYRAAIMAGETPAGIARSTNY